MRSLFLNEYKGGLIKSSDDEEWSYSNGLLTLTDTTKNLVIAYRWDGQNLLGVSDSGMPSFHQHSTLDNK